MGLHWRKPFFAQAQVTFGRLLVLRSKGPFAPPQENFLSFVLIWPLSMALWFATLKCLRSCRGQWQRSCRLSQDRGVFPGVLGWESQNSLFRGAKPCFGSLPSATQGNLGLHGVRDSFGTLGTKAPNHLQHSPNAPFGILAVIQPNGLAEVQCELFGPISGLSFGRWILGGEFLKGEFFRGPLLLEKSEKVQPKNSGPKFRRPNAPAEARRWFFWFLGRRFWGKVGGNFSDPQKKGSKISGKISEHFAWENWCLEKNLSCKLRSASVPP